jgi:hypothetical protein
MNRNISWLMLHDACMLCSGDASHVDRIDDELALLVAVARSKENLLARRYGDLCLSKAVAALTKRQRVRCVSEQRYWLRRYPPPVRRAIAFDSAGPAFRA